MVEPCQKSCQIQNACTGYIGCPFPKRASMMALLILFLLHLRIRHMTTRFPTCKTHRDRARKPRAFMPGRNSPPQRKGAFHFFAQASPGTAGVEGGRRRKGLCQE